MRREIYVTEATLPPIDEYIAEITEIWNSHRLTNMGPKHNELEKRLKDYLQIDNMSLMVNGHMALELAIQAFHLQGEVITTPFTFVSTTHAIVRNGLQPVFCDINEVDCTIDVDKIEDLITEKTAAIMPVHVYGRVCDVEEIDRIAKKHNLKVIYDAAHAFGVRKDGKSVLKYGDASVLSFHATKAFNSIEGGAVVYRQEELGKELYRLKNFGFRGELEVDGIGANAKMDEFRAAMGLCNLKHIDDYIKRRKRVYDKYEELLANQKGIRFLPEQSGVTYNYAYCPVFFDEKILGTTRDEIYDWLKKNNIYSRRYFYPLVTAYECYNKDFSSENTPVAKQCSERVLCLPLYPDLDLGTVERICDLIIQCIHG